MDTPEEIIWNTDIALNLLNDFSNEDSEVKISELETLNKFKEKFIVLSDCINQESTSNTIFYLQKMFIHAWIKSNNENYQFIVNIINSIVK